MDMTDAQTPAVQLELPLPMPQTTPQPTSDHKGQTKGTDAPKAMQSRAYPAHQCETQEGPA